MKRKDFLLSQHFSYREMTRSAWADRNHVDNTPDCLQLAALENLCRVLLEPMYARFGPVAIRSAFHSEVVNIGMHDVGDSRHLRGEAVDIVLSDGKMAHQYYCFILQHVDYDQLFFEYDRAGNVWLHCSVCLNPKDNRHQAFPNYHTA